MTGAIADTDVLSTFGKIGRMDLLRLLFEPLYVAPAVYRELLRAEQVGFIWVSRVKQSIELFPLTESQSREAEQLFVSYPQLGYGEVETFVLAQRHRLICLTNDRQAKQVAGDLGLAYLDLEEILWALKARRILITEDLARLIEQIEDKDHTRIKAKDQLLGS